LRNDLVQHGIGILNQSSGLSAYLRIIQYFGILAGKHPGAKKGCPVQVVTHHRKIQIQFHIAKLCRYHWIVIAPVNESRIISSLPITHHLLYLLLCCMAASEGLIAFLGAVFKLFFAFVSDRLTYYRNGFGRIGRVYHCTTISRIDFDGSVDRGSGRPADQQGYLYALSLHFRSYIGPLV